MLREPPKKPKNFALLKESETLLLDLNPISYRGAFNAPLILTPKSNDTKLKKFDFS